MRYINGRVDVVSVGALFLAVVGMEVLYARAMFGGTWEGWAIMLAVVALHAIKPRLLVAAGDATSWRKLATGTAWLFLMVLSFVAAVGFLAHIRHDMLAVRVGTIEAVKAIDGQIADLQARARINATVRDASVIQADIATHLSKPMQGQAVSAMTRKCDPAHPATPTAAPCRDVLRLRQELALAAYVARASAEIADLERKREWTAKTSGADPQVEAFTRLTGASVETVQTAIIVVLAVAIEVGMTMAPYALLRNREAPAAAPPSPRNRRRRASSGTVTAAGHSAPNRDPASRPASGATVVPFRSNVRAFVERHLVRADGASVTGGEIQVAYAAFRAATGHPPRGGNAVMLEVQAVLGIKPVKNGRGCSEYRGVGLRQTAETAA